MSEATEQPAEQDGFGTRLPFDLNAKLAAKVADLGLGKHLDQIRDEG